MSLHGGAANKNIGDAFLLVRACFRRGVVDSRWRFTPPPEVLACSGVEAAWTAWQAQQPRHGAAVGAAALVQQRHMCEGGGSGGARHRMPNSPGAAWHFTRCRRPAAMRAATRNSMEVLQGIAEETKAMADGALASFVIIQARVLRLGARLALRSARVFLFF